jgi:hypothetical protein
MNSWRQFPLIEGTMLSVAHSWRSGDFQTLELGLNAGAPGSYRQKPAFNPGAPRAAAALASFDAPGFGEAAHQ